jgi:hypothetical protein
VRKLLLACALLFALPAYCAHAAHIIADVPPADMTAKADSCVATFNSVPATTAIVTVTPIIVDNVNGIAADNFEICYPPVPASLPYGQSTVTLAAQVTGSSTQTTAVGVASAPFSFANSTPPPAAPTTMRLAP